MRVRSLLAAAISGAVLLPPALGWALQILESELVRQTEEELLAEAVTVGEMYRELAGLGAASIPSEERWFPILPRIDLRSSPILEPGERRGAVDPSPSPASRALSEILNRVQIRNLSLVRVLDPRGRVIASSSGEVGYTLDHLSEVKAALQGGYAPVLRTRQSKHQVERGGISRAAGQRVSIAIPVFADPRASIGSGGDVIAVVYENRTPLEPGEWVYRRRSDLIAIVLVSTLTLGLLVGFLGFAIARPLQELRRSADQVSTGADRPLFAAKRAPDEVRALALALERMRAELLQRATYIRDFAAHVVHELKTPLTSIRGAAELVLDSEMSAEQRARFVGNIREDAVRMDSLVRRILELARVEAAPPKRAPTELFSLARQVADRLGGDVRVESKLGRPTHPVEADAVESLIANLVENALRHGEGRPVEVTLREIDGFVEIEVRDYGEPKPAEHFERVFERFYTTERARGGTGLGLAIVKAVAEAHGGGVRVEPREAGVSFLARLRV